MQDLAMLLLGALVLFSGVGVIAAPSAVYSALFLTTNLLGVAVLFLALSSQFMAVAQLLIYAGAVMVVFLFAITVLAPDEEVLGDGADRTIRLVGAFTGVFLTAALAVIVKAGGPVGQGGSGGPTTVEAFAQQLFGRYLLPFEGTAFLLLVALVAAVTLGGRRQDS